MVVYQLINDKFVKLGKDAGMPILGREESSAVGDDFSMRGSQHSGNDAGKIIQTSIKDHNNLQKILKNMPLPLSFNLLAFVVVFCVVVASGIGIAEHLLLKTLFDNFYSEMSFGSVQFGQVRAMAELSTWITQAVAVNKYADRDHSVGECFRCPTRTRRSAAVRSSSTGQ